MRSNFAETVYFYQIFCAQFDHLLFKLRPRSFYTSSGRTVGLSSIFFWQQRERVRRRKREGGGGSGGKREVEGEQEGL